MPPYEVRIEYDEATVRLAAWRFLARFARSRDFLIGLGLLAVALGAWLGLRLDFGSVAILLGLAVILIAFAMASGLLYVRAALAKFRALKDPTVVWRFSDEVISTRSDLGQAEIPWRLVTRVLRFPEVWLLFFGPGGYGYSTLPTAGLNAELRDYVVARVRANGGKVE